MERSQRPKNTFEKERTVHQEKSNVLDARHEALEQEFVKSERRCARRYLFIPNTLPAAFDLQKEKQQIVTRISAVDSRLQTELVVSGANWLAYGTEGQRRQG